MKKTFLALLLAGTIMSSCKQKREPQNEINPFFTEFNTPFQTPPFDKIKLEHYMPAYKEAIKQRREEIEKIANNPQTPTFANTIEAYENSGKFLDRVSGVFYNQTIANTNDSLQKYSKELSPMLSKLSADIMMNEQLFSRIKVVYQDREKLGLSTEESTLLDKVYKSFVRGGANLDPEKKERLRQINSRLSILSLQFGENKLKETNAFKLILDKKEDLAGLPQSSIDAAAETAKNAGEEGKWMFTIHKPSLIPFLQFSERRDLREKMFKGYINVGDNNNENDNKAIASEIVKLRVEKAKIFGYNNYAEMRLERNMAKNPENVFNLLNKVWYPALSNAKKEVKEMQKIIDREGRDFKLEAWDWWYYAEKVKKEKYNLDDNELRPYFKLENVRNGAFKVASNLYGIKFKELDNISKYHEDVQTWQVVDKDDSHLGILYLDYHPRASKRGGAWMNHYRKQSGAGTDQKVYPIICNCGNLTAPTGDTPALISLDEVETVFHEFGHAIHGLLSNCKYNYLSGTSVPRDFVELPSQIMENWAMEPQVLKMYARHYKTGEIIPDALIEKIQNASLFNQGFTTVEYMAAALLDMKYHTINEIKDIDINNFEKNTLKELGLIPEIVSRYRSSYFAHIFSGGYPSGYYAYIWGGVLDTDAFQAFKETSLFDQKTAELFRTNIVSRGGSEDPMVLYKRFRGAEPSIEPLLKKRGLK